MGPTNTRSGAAGGSQSRAGARSGSSRTAIRRTAKTSSGAVAKTTGKTTVGNATTKKAAGKKAAGKKVVAKKPTDKNAAGKKPAGRPRKAPARDTEAGPGLLPFDGGLEPGGAPASRRALRNQGRRTMRKLLDAAMEAFDRRGYHATRVNDVVEIAKTSHGTFYLYFSNKEDLLRALVAEAAAEAAELYTTMAEPPAEGTGWENLRAWVGQYSALWVRYAPLLRAWTDLAAIDPELGEQVRQTVGAMSRALARQIEAPRTAGGIDPDAAGMAVLAMLDRFHYLREFVGQPIDDTALDTLTTIVHRGLFDGPISDSRVAARG